MAQAEQVLELESKPPVRKSGKKLLALLSAGLLLVGGAGAGAWYFLGQSGADAPAKEEAPKAPVFVRLEPFIVNIQPAEEGRYLQAEIVLRVASEEQAEIFKQHMPEVRNRLLLLLSGKHAEELIPADGKERLAQEIMALMKKPFVSNGEPQDISGVFFTSFIIQ